MLTFTRARRQRSRASAARRGRPAAQGAQGPVGPQGATGAKGDKGDKGGFSGLVTRHYDYIKGGDYPGAGSGGIATVACDDDPAVSQKMVAIGGGVQFLDVGRNAGVETTYVGETHITDSFPGRMDWDTNTPKPNRLDGWIVRLNNTPSVDMRVWVTCVDAPTAS